MLVMNDKKMRQLELLSEMVAECKDCNLYKNGKVIPYYTPLSRYIIIGEAPGREEVEQNEPFVGKAGNFLMKALFENGYRKEDFCILNSVNCRPIDGNKNGKPRIGEQQQCFKWIRKYIKVVEPYKILLLGNYACATMGFGDTGIMNKNGRKVELRSIAIREGNVIPEIYLSIHPSMCIYKGEEGEKMLDYSIKRFRGE